MGDEDDEVPEGPGTYTLITDAGEKKSSIGFSGRAKAAYANGDVYEGVFENGVRQGRGSYRYVNGDLFEGTFENNVKTGLGKMKYKKGGYFHGYFHDGKRHGEGTFQYANGDIYSGSWHEGKKHGQGSYMYAKTKYEITGEWKEGQIVQGAWTLTDGSKFVGAFRNQKPVGDGVWHNAAGTIVEGTYVQQMVPNDGDDATPPVYKLFWKTGALVATTD